MENKFSQKQIANWRRVRQNIEADLVKLNKVDEKIQSIQADYEEKAQALKAKYDEKIKDIQTESDTLRQMIDIQETPVKIATGGFTTQDIFAKEWQVNDKVDTNGKQIRKAIYVLRYPETIIPPVKTESSTVINESVENNETINM